MRKTIFLTVLLTVFLLCFTAFAAPLRINPLRVNPQRTTPVSTAENKPRPVSLKDFSHTYQLKTELEGALYKVLLPEFVYSGLVHSQNRDLAVFNSNGELVPFVVFPASPVYDNSSVSRVETSIPFFELPVEEDVREDVGPVDIYVRTSKEGQVVEVKGGSTSGALSASRNRRYFLDFTSLDTSIPSGNSAFHRLELSVPDESELNVTVDVFQSENLRDWSPILQGAPLIQLQNRNSRFANNSFDLPRAPRRYLLLRINNVDAPFVLRGVNYSSSVTESRLIEKNEFTTFAGTAAQDRLSVEYDTKGAFPVSKVNFVLQEPGFYKVHYSARSDKKGNWRQLGSMELSLIRESASSLRSNSSENVDLRENRYWRIEFEQPFSGPLLPEMKINWHASEVYFLAQGKPPYILAFGSSREDLRLQNTSFAQDQALRTGATETEIGEPLNNEITVVSTKEIEREEISSDREWERYVVWVVLVLGALLLAGIALKLLKSGAPDESPDENEHS